MTNKSVSALTAIPEFEVVADFEEAHIDPQLKFALESIHIRIELHYQRKMERLRQQEEKAAEATKVSSSSSNADDSHKLKDNNAGNANEQTVAVKSPDLNSRRMSASSKRWIAMFKQVVF
jgi:hypothetical protein